MTNDESQQTNHKKAAILFLLKELADDDTFYLVCYALFHSDTEISIGAALVLGHLRDARALNFLLRALLTTDQKRAEAIMWALGEIGDDKSVPYLKDALEAGFAMKSAILALGKIGAPTIARSLLNSLHHKDETVRALAARALSQLRFEQQKPAILDLLPELKNHLARETSRRVKLMIAITLSRLERIPLYSQTASDHG